MESRISGIIKRYHVDRGWGLIFTYPTASNGQVALPVKWFFHFTEVLSGTPQIGCVATFTPAPRRSAGDLPTAKQVEIGEMTVRYSPGAVR